jgi:hypothetical protein
MILSKRSHEGEIFLDHRASPGFTAEQAKKLGYVETSSNVGEGQLLEAPTMGCAHCNTVVIMNPDRKRDREWCSSCDRYICDNCGLERKLPGYEHKSFRQKLTLALIQG